jgi:hypothetical protein
MDEQKKAVQIRPPMACHWGPNDECLRNGRVTRLSVTYRTCFIQTKAPANDGHTMFVKIWLPDEFTVTMSLANNFMLIRGTVAHYSPKIGFGLHFGELTKGENDILSMLVNFYQDKKSASTENPSRQDK